MIKIGTDFDKDIARQAQDFRLQTREFERQGYRFIREVSL
jgi:hypothetical protein